jgi:hypothetical protein
VKNIYWPVVLILIGLGFIIASTFNKSGMSPNE